MLPGKRSNIISYLILIVLMLTWGSSFILIKKGLTVFSSMQVGALRVGITFLVLLPFAFKKLKSLSRRHWAVLCILSLLSAAPPFLFPMAQIGIDSATTGVLNSLTPLFTLIVGMVFFHLSAKWFNILGVMIGLVGAVGLVSVSGEASFKFNFGYAIFAIIATVFYAFNGNLVKYYLKDLDSFTITIFSFFICGLPILVYLFAGTNYMEKLNHDPMFWEGMAYIATLAVLGTAAAMVIFNYLIKLTSAVFASSVTYLIPVVALMWGIIDGETFGFMNALWIACILLGVFLVNAKQMISIRWTGINIGNLLRRTFR